MKAYIKPTSEVINLTPESMLAASDPRVNDKYSSGEMYSNKKAWNSSQWSSPQGEDE